MSKFDKIVELYMDETFERNRENRACHVAFLLKGKKVIQTGFNQMDRQCFRGKCITSLHAEIDCLRKARPITELIRKNYSLLVINISKEAFEDDDHPHRHNNVHSYYKNSKPCSNCTKFLMGLNFKFIYCSNENGEIEKLYLDTYEPYVTISQTRLSTRV